ncbi:retrotransposon protein, partial [Striga asiatica]
MQPVATQQLFEEEASGTDGGEPLSRLCVFSPQEQREGQGSKANLIQKKDALIVHKLLEQHQMGQGMEMEEQRQVAVVGVEQTSEVEFSTEAMDVREEVQLRNNRTWRRAIRQRTIPLKSIEEEGEDQKGKTKKRGRKLGMEDRWKLVEPVGISGGLLLMWNLEVEIKHVKCSEFSIGVEFRMEGEAMWEWCTFVYMNTDKRVRTLQWSQLTEEKNDWGRNGRLESYMLEEEKKGGRLRSEASMLGFRGFVEGMGMKELDMIGQSYTWGNNREGEGFVEERIDEAFASFDWLVSYPSAIVQSIFKSASDHCMLLVKRRFKFDKRWTKEEEIRDRLLSVWDKELEGTPMRKVEEKIKLSRLALRNWDWQKKSNSREQVEKLSLSKNTFEGVNRSVCTILEGIKVQNSTRSTKLTDWNWVVNGPTKIKQGAVGIDIWVADLMANGGRNWDERLVRGTLKKLKVD